MSTAYYLVSSVEDDFLDDRYTSVYLASKQSKAELYVLKKLLNHYGMLKFRFFKKLELLKKQELDAEHNNDHDDDSDSDEHIINGYMIQKMTIDEECNAQRIYFDLKSKENITNLSDIARRLNSSNEYKNQLNVHIDFLENIQKERENIDAQTTKDEKAKRELLLQKNELELKLRNSNL